MTTVDDWTNLEEVPAKRGVTTEYKSQPLQNRLEKRTKKAKQERSASNNRHICFLSHGYLGIIKVTEYDIYQIYDHPFDIAFSCNVKQCVFQTDTLNRVWLLFSLLVCVYICSTYRYIIALSWVNDADLIYQIPGNIKKTLASV